MKSTHGMKAAAPRSVTRRIEHEAEGGASGALAGAIVGASAGLPGAIAGAIFGGAAGVLAGAVLDQESSARDKRTRELDEDIGVSGGDLGAPNLAHPPPTSRAYSEAPSAREPADGVSFWVRSPVVGKVHGTFTGWCGSLLLDEQTPQNSRLEVEIDASSIDTNEPRRDAHLRSADFFDVEKYPKLIFRSTMIERVGDRFKVTGDLTMHGVTKPVTLNVEYADRARHPPMGERAGFFAYGSLNRRDWGLDWNLVLDVGRLALGDEIAIQMGIEAKKAS